MNIGMLSEYTEMKRERLRPIWNYSIRDGKKKSWLGEIVEVLFRCHCCFIVAAASVVRRSKGPSTSSGMQASLSSFARLTLTMQAEGPL